MNDPKSISQEEEEVLQSGFPDETREELSLLSVADLEAEERDRAREPALTDPGWSQYVLSQFTEDELDREGHPLVHGLRRVVRLLLGPILEARARVIQAPQLLGGFEHTSILQPACVEYTVRILMCKLEQGLREAYPVDFTDCADCYFGNTDPDFARYPTATASTRAEARALRKALQLKQVASEELTRVPTAEAGLGGFITPEQINFLNVLCHRNNINLLAYVNAGKTKFVRVEEVPFGVAQTMVEYLSGLQRDPASVPASLKGYDHNWRNG